MTYDREALSNPLYAEDIINNLEHQLEKAKKDNEKLTGVLHGYTQQMGLSLLARDEAVDELHKVIDAYETLWLSFPHEVMVDHLGEHYKNCLDIYDTYFE